MAKEINKRIAELEAKLDAGETLSTAEERYLMKHRDNMSDEDIDFILSGLPEESNPSTIVYLRF